ncbi:hypothetical protein DXG01_015539 [Tephrocybe rancida]|nr:hypothetical protein DXG01_015539 [Tephrocybe rancida]
MNPLQRNIFVDLEAVEDYRNEDEILADSEDNDFDDFLDDEVYLDDDDTASPGQILHKLAASTISELEWEGLVKRAEQRTQQETALGEQEQDDSEEDDSDNDQRCLERMGLAKLGELQSNITLHSPVSYMWKNNQFEYGFLVLVSHDIKPAVVTHKELEFFRHSGVIPLQALAAVEDEITKSLLQEGDLVMVHRGEMRGRVGIITRADVDGNEVLVWFETSNIETSIHTSDLRKSIKLGDHVSVVGGDDHGRVGCVVARNAAGELALWDDATQTHCRPNLSQASLVDFDKIPDYCKEAAQAMEKLREENHKKYMNRRVQIVGKHPLKDYEGIVREILYDDKVKVEIAVTLKREEVHLLHLANRDDPDHLPFLQVAPHAQLPREPREEMAIPLLNMPLTLPMPIPSPYLDPKLKVKVRVHNTKPVLDDPGFRNDLKVLDFVSTLFLHVTPNNTGWTDTVETFLTKQGYKLASEGSLQKQFGNALVWYNVLQDATTHHIDQILRIACHHAIEIDDGIDILHEYKDNNPFLSPCPSSSDKDTPPQSPLLAQSPPTPSQPPHTPRCYPTVEDKDEGNQEDSSILVAGFKHGHDEDNVEEPSNPFPDPLARMRPSDYLRARCPLCFGGEFPTPCPECDRPNDNPDAIMYVDACFTQKRNCQSQDPPRTHPCTVFIPEVDAEVMEKYVEFIRSKKASTRKKPNTEEPDHFKGSLHVPKSVLDGCEAGFTAADSCCEKASTQFFDDTALMVLLCHHNVVLFITNMRSAGEKQHYVMVLLETLFQHLPLPYRVGLLYDIGCQTECSCIKWNFLDRYIDRTSFGISIFHAFGHQWACQLIYHPQKRTGFGLSDREGCERFWHSISWLIDYLRVCGYHQRLYTLDHQVDHAQKETLKNLGAWLLRQSWHALAKQKAAESILQECGKLEADLRAEWKAQANHKMQGKMQSRNCSSCMRREMGSRSEYNALMEDEATPMDEYTEAKDELESVRLRLQELSTRIHNK